jgi:methionine biosynthesis protein MetW
MKEEIHFLPTGINRMIREIIRSGWHEQGIILDCGCGPGEVAEFIGKELKAGDVFGLDISEERVRGAVTRGIKAITADVDRGKKIPFDDGAFDLVFCNHVIEHLFDPDHLLDELSRILKSEGILVLTTPNLAAWYNRIILLFGFQPHFTEVSTRSNVGKLYCGKLKEDSCSAIGGHVRIFTYPALKELLLIHKFHIVSSFGYGHPSLLNSVALGIFERFFQLNKTFSSTLCFILKKAP